jgi:hypothetical protein
MGCSDQELELKLQRCFVISLMWSLKELKEFFDETKKKIILESPLLRLSRHKQILEMKHSARLLLK